MTYRVLLIGAALLCAAAPARAVPVRIEFPDADPLRWELARRIADRIPEWPGTEVEIPLRLYQRYLYDLKAEPPAPVPPETAWIQRADYLLRPADGELGLAAAYDIVVLPPAPGEKIPGLPVFSGGLPWRDVKLDGNPYELGHRGEANWFLFDPPGPGRYRLEGATALKADKSDDQYHASWLRAPAAVTTASVESDRTWEVWFDAAPLRIVGDEKGTRGMVGLVPGLGLRAWWRPPLPPVHRDARIEIEPHVGWTIADGVHQVRAVLEVRLWGGTAEQVVLDFAPGADRIEVRGPDVREVQVRGSEAQVLLRGQVRQRTRLEIACEVPRQPTGRMAFPALGVRGAASRGGTLAVAGGGGAVLLELETPGLRPVALRDLPSETLGLLAAPAVYGYEITAATWDARFDLVAMAEFPVRETIVDSALYTVLYRPEGRLMTKVLYEVRNRTQQYMKVELPAGARLLLARVFEKPVNLARGPDGSVYVPLEKSVLTAAGLVSFPVELVYIAEAPPLERSGRLRLSLPRTDLTVAYARCALMLPDGMRVKEWAGSLRQVPAWSSETAELEFEYGRGYRPAEPEKPVRPPPAQPPPQPPERPRPTGVGRLTFRRAPAEGAPEQPPPDAQAAAENDLVALGLQAKNSYRAGVQAYQRGNYEQARSQFENVLRVAPQSAEAPNAAMFLENVSVALGKGADDRDGQDRALRAVTKAVQRGHQAANVDLLQRQQDLLEQARQAQRQGDAARAKAAYELAVDLSGQLTARGEEVREQDALVREARGYLSAHETQQNAKQQRIARLQEQVSELRSSLVQKAGKDVVEIAEAFDKLEGSYSGVSRERDRLSGYAAPADQPAQVEVGKALAAQHLKSGAGQLLPADLAPEDDAEIERLEKKMKRLGEVQKQMEAVTVAGTATLVLDGDGVLRPEPTIPVMAALPGLATPEPRAGAEPEVARKPVAVAALGDLKKVEQQVEERARGLQVAAREAEELARSGRVEEAGRLIERIQKEAEQAQVVVEGTSGAFTIGGGGRGWGSAYFEDINERLAARAAAEPASTRIITLNNASATDLARVLESLLVQRADGRERPPPRITASAAGNALTIKGSAADLEYIANMAQQLDATAAAPGGQRTAVRALTDVEEAAIRSGEMAHGETRYLRYPPARQRQESSASRADVARAAAAEPPPVAETRRRLKEKVDLDFQRTGVDDVLKYLSEVQRGLNIVVDPDLEAQGIDLSTRVVDLKLRQVSVESVLALILGADLGYRVEAGYVLITPRGKLAERRAAAAHPVQDMAAYPVEDLVARVPGFGGQAPRFEAGDERKRAALPEGAGEAGWQQLVDIIKTNVSGMADPSVAAWDDQGGPAHIDYMDGTVIVSNQTPEGRRRINELLDRLRREAAARPGGRPETKAAAELRALQHRLSEAQRTVEEEKREREVVEYSVDDIVPREENGRKLAEFIASNYGWSMQPPAQPDGRAEPAPAHVTTTAAGLAGGTLRLGGANVTFSGGTLTVANDPDATGQVEAVLERLRANWGQRVQVGSRNVGVSGGDAAQVGIAWQEGANGVTYAIVDEGQLMGLLDLEQRQAVPVLANVPAVGRLFRQDAVVGTSAILADGGTVEISRSADAWNGMVYLGNDLEVAHDAYLLINNGGFVTAVKSGQMQHWAADVAPVEFPGVPAVVAVPAVGWTVKFEKTLLEPQDRVELVAHYAWEGEEK